MPFAVPYVAPNPDSWGPPPVSEEETTVHQDNAGSKYAGLPYQPFGRSDRLGRAADFTQSVRGYADRGSSLFFSQSRHREPRGQQQQRDSLRGSRRGSLGMDDSHRGGDEVEDDDEQDKGDFLLVDTSKTHNAPKRFVNPASRRRQHSQRLRQVNARRQGPGGGGGAGTSFDKLGGGRGGGRFSGGRFGGGRGGGRFGGRGGGRYGGRGGRGGYRNYSNRVDRQSSVAVQADWKQVEEVDLGKLTKHLANTATDAKSAAAAVPEPTDVLWCGFLDPYNDAYDKVTARQPVPLKRMEHKEFYPVTTTDDPVLEKLAIDGAAQVFITDAILAHLQTCTRSVYPWDVVIQKLPNGTLFFDKRDNTQFDYLTVQETAYNPPTDEDGINAPERLGLEATVINQNFSQQILKKSGRTEMDLPNPFFDEEDADGMEPASVAYRYRKFALDDSTTVLVRTELHGTVKKTQNMTAFCLNEYTPTTDKGQPAPPHAVDWRDKMDSQRGAVLATELKNNSFKIAKWTAQSLLAGADQMKIGFVSRKDAKNNYEHVILGTQFYRPKDFATQITLSETQMWAIFRNFVQMLQKQPEGKYVLMREPNKAMLRLFQVPPNTFDDAE